MWKPVTTCQDGVAPNPPPRERGEDLSELGKPGPLPRSEGQRLPRAAPGPPPQPGPADPALPCPALPGGPAGSRGSPRGRGDPSQGSGCPTAGPRAGCAWEIKLKVNAGFKKKQTRQPRVTVSRLTPAEQVTARERYPLETFKVGYMDKHLFRSCFEKALLLLLVSRVGDTDLQVEPPILEAMHLGLPASFFSPAPGWAQRMEVHVLKPWKRFFLSLKGSLKTRSSLQ